MLLRQRKNRRRSTSKTTCRFERSSDPPIAPLEQGVYGRADLRGLRKIVLAQRKPNEGDLFAGVSLQTAVAAPDGEPQAGAADGTPADVEEAKALSLLWHKVHANQGEPEALSTVYRTEDHQSYPDRSKETQSRITNYRWRIAPAIHEQASSGRHPFP